MTAGECDRSHHWGSRSAWAASSTSSASTTARCPVGRVVVRVSDGAELGTGRDRLPARRRSTATLPGDRAPLPPDWALQVPADYVEVLRTAVPRRCAAAGIDPADVIGIGTDFTACTVLPVLADGTPLCELPEYAGPPARLGQAVEAPRGAAAGRPHQRPRGRARRAAGCRATAGGSPRSGSSPRACSCSRRTPRSTARWTTGSRPPTGSSGSCRGTESRNACTAGYKGIYQDGRYPDRGLPRRAQPGLRRLRRPTSWRTAIGQLGEPRGHAHRARRRRWTGLPEGIAVAVGNVDAHVTAPAAGAIEPGQMVAIMGTSTCHVMNGDDARARCPACAASSTAGSSAGCCGYEAGQSGVGDIFALVRRELACPPELPRGGRARAAGRCTST